MIPTLQSARLTWPVNGCRHATAARVGRTERLAAVLGLMAQTPNGNPGLACRHSGAV